MTEKPKKTRLSLEDYRRFNAVLWDLRKPIAYIIAYGNITAVSRPLKQAFNAVWGAIGAIGKAWKRDYPGSGLPDERVEGFPDPFSDGRVLGFPPLERVPEYDEEGLFALRLNEPGNGDFFQTGDVFMFRTFEAHEKMYPKDIVASLVNGKHWLIEQLTQDLDDETSPEWNDRMFYSRFRAGYRAVEESDTVEIKGVFKVRKPKNTTTGLLFGFPKGDLSRRIPCTPEGRRDMDRMRVACGHAPWLEAEKE